MIGFGWGALVYAAFNKIIWLMLVLAIPVSGLFEMLAFYRRDGQDFEKILIALVGFGVNSRRRIWHRDDTAKGLKVEPVKVAAKAEQPKPADIRGELERLSNLIDSRGWNEQQIATGGNVVQPQTTATDRIVMPIAPTLAAGEEETKPVEDILDLKNSPLAQNLAGLIQQASNEVRQEAISQMRSAPGNGINTIPVTPFIKVAAITKQEAASLNPAVVAPAQPPKTTSETKETNQKLIEEAKAAISRIATAPATPAPVPAETVTIIPAASVTVPAEAETRPQPPEPPEPPIVTPPVSVTLAPSSINPPPTPISPETLAQILAAPSPAITPGKIIQPGSVIKPDNQ